MLIIDIATEIYSSLDSPEITSIPAICTWLQYTAITKLNVLLCANFQPDGEDVTPELNGNQAAILTQLYSIYYYDKIIRVNLGAAAYDWSEIVEGDTNIRRVSKNEIAKNYIQLKKAANDDLVRMILYYRKGLNIPASWSSFNSRTWKFNRIQG